MDRRKFIKVSVPVTAITVGKDRLFGKPASAMESADLEKSKFSESHNDLVKYRLSNLKINPSNWSYLVNLNNLWSEICHDESSASEFLRNTKHYLAEMGVHENQQLALSSEINALKVFADQEILTSVKKGDHEHFFKILSEKQIINTLNNESQLRERLDSHFANMLTLMDKNNDGADSLYTLYEELGLLDHDRNFKIVPGNQVVPVAAVAIVVIAISVVIYATVGVGAGAGILVAVAISIAAATAVAVGAGGGSHGNNLDPSIDDREPSIIADMSIAAQISSMFGNEELAQSIIEDIENVKTNVGMKLDEIIDMAVEHGLMNFDGVNEKRVRSSLHSLVNNQIMQIV